MRRIPQGIHGVVWSLALLLMAGPVSSDTFNLGSLGDGTYSFNRAVLAAPFSDTYNFSLADAHGAAVTTVDVELYFGAEALFDITNLGFGLYDSGDSLLSPVGQLSFSGWLAAGNYHFEISGTGSGTKGGYYSGLLDIAPIPETEAWAMMLVGVGLMGYWSRRRRA